MCFILKCPNQIWSWKSTRDALYFVSVFIVKHSAMSSFNNTTSDSFIDVVDVDGTSVTLKWPNVANSFSLEMKTEDGEFTTLSSSLSINEVKKKNLLYSTKYYFRIKPQNMDITYELKGKDACIVLQDRDETRPTAPTLVKAEKDALTVQWDRSVATEYCLRYRKAGESWTNISSAISGTSVRKKNLNGTYFFAVAPRREGDDGGDASCNTDIYEWSASSAPFSTIDKVPLNVAFSQTLPKALLRMVGESPSCISAEDALAGKVVAIYFSASWCGPCRQFSASLKQLYATIKVLIPSSSYFHSALCGCFGADTHSTFHLLFLLNAS